ncbi:hypothetical protein AQS70_21730 [Pseudomonas endophytica]|uniref:Thymidine phosphorylase n=1 Tax=Pseudomonas endophytica TaxID=1563157 RepID=A0A0Q0XV69_9PSED|nr:hypothetical protein [Pseudomonas endophytica]KQB54485.1 hypothetical protein AQS70_21730 [Pseudomonas endophytica]
MNKSAALTLAQATAAAREGGGSLELLSLPLTPAQSGCALRLTQAGALITSGAANSAVLNAELVVKKVFLKGSEAASMLGRAADPQTFESVAGRWFDSGQQGGGYEVAAGYWLADAFIRGVGPSEAGELTNFLAGRIPLYRPRSKVSVRRYPTGGISEKQALILPPIMRALAREFSWCSPFLVAGKLAHTGGTRDKLAVIPGFKISKIADLPMWNGVDRPVRYFSADAELCPRDAMMYRLRGETGTVADTGLMASSIMSKQIALPADVIILDILHGPTAFLKTRVESEKFGGMCEAIGLTNGVKIVSKLRESKNILGRSVGSSTEIVEAAELLRGDIYYELGGAEIATSIGFIRVFAEELGLDPELVCHRAEVAIKSGDAFDAMLDLFLEHGVDSKYVRSFSCSPRDTVLGGIDKTTILASDSGTVKWDAMSVADIANYKINSPAPKKYPICTVRQGGVELLAQDGSPVKKGDPLAVIYGEDSESVAGSLSVAVSIST